MNREHPLILAHRGACLEAPENTLAAIELALEGPWSADGFECDVRLSRDGIPVLFHDDHTEALTGQPGTIEARTAAEISCLRVHAQPIPTLAHVLARVLDRRARTDWAPASINIELKPNRDPRPLIRACVPVLAPLLTLGERSPLVVSSFDPRVLAAAEKDAPAWRLALLYKAPSTLDALGHLQRGASLDLHPHHSLVNPGHLEAYAHPGRKFRTWTVDDVALAKKLGELNIAAIITNRPRHLGQNVCPPNANGTTRE